ncbi:putative amino acid transporter [Trypanosoma theileri]|uniref:Putative amino acid transporter n=1 Tax=Trypanosoma theileri TaxID=67003 RepID=A0A1X0NKV2_9TRYP|nr:putative amino acid transporter [Trypanosoma theileri]ORC84789.1 putative amino acid transporter [Trypanosoma theileri]
MQKDNNNNNNTSGDDDHSVDRATGDGNKYPIVNNNNKKASTSAGEKLSPILGEMETTPHTAPFEMNEESSTPTADENRKKKRNCIVHVGSLILDTIIPYGGILSSSFNLASATLGAGITSLPSAFNLSGIVMSILYIVLISMATVYSMHLLAKVILKTGVRTYEEAARKLLGRGADYFLAALVMFLCFGGSVAYIIVTGALLTPVLTNPSSPAFLQTKSGIRLITSLIWLFFILPLVIMKRINSLRYCSAIGVLCILYFVLCVCIHSGRYVHHNGVAKDLTFVKTGNGALDGLSLFMFSFICQLNAFEIFHEMKRKTVFYFTISSTIGVTICAVLYFLAGLFGYLEFGSKVTDSVLTLYDPVKDLMMAVAYIGIIFKICVAFALHLIPMRDAIYHCLSWDVNTLPYWKHGIIMTIPALLALICGLFIPKVNTVLGLLGAFCGGTIGIILPPLFFMYSGGFSVKEVGIFTYCATYLILFFGVIAVVFGTVSTVSAAVKSSF